MIGLLANENVHWAIVRALRDAGCDVGFVPEVGLGGCSDREILAYAEERDLVLISGDKDFGGLTEFGPCGGAAKWPCSGTVCSTYTAPSPTSSERWIERNRSSGIPVPS